MALARSSMAMKTASRPLRSRVARASVRVSAKAGNWLPGSAQPAWLPENLPGTYGFDPLGLAKEPALLARFTESELIHCRWAMLGAAGVLAVEVGGYGNWIDVQKQILNAPVTYLGQPNPLDLNTLVGVEFLAFAISEGLRGAEQDKEKNKYPGGSFDFFNLSKTAAFEENKLKEIKNGRLAMLACVGFYSQYVATGKTPLQNLGEHLSNPWVNNFATNGVSIPYL